MAHLNVLIAASQEQGKVPQSDTKEKNRQTWNFTFSVNIDHFNPYAADISK